jgi:AcrR family transcriptional regulator
MKTTRSYTMTARARAVEATRASVVAAVGALSAERRLADISLDEVAAAAGVSVQTVLRQFGSRAELFETAARLIRDEVVDERRTPVGDVCEAVRVITEHYEQRGDSVLLMLAQEGSEDLMARAVADGRALHRGWVAEVFAPYLPERDRDEAVDLLVVATDVYTWKLLRRDRGLSRTHTRQQMERLVRAVLTDLGTRTEE